MGRRGSSYNKGVSYDQRYGTKVLGRKLKQDGETGIWTTDPDPVHPQRFVRTPGPDGAHWRPGSGRMDAIGDTWDIKDAWWSVEDGSFIRHPFALMLTVNVPGFSET